MSDKPQKQTQKSRPVNFGIGAVLIIEAVIDDDKNYCKWGKICWAKLSHFSWFSGVPQKFFCEFKHLSLIVLNNGHLWPKAMQKYFCENFDGAETTNI